MEEKSAFEILLEEMIKKGFEEEYAANLINDVIKEQEEINTIRSSIRSIYQLAKEKVDESKYN